MDNNIFGATPCDSKASVETMVKFGKEHYTQFFMADRVGVCHSFILKPEDYQVLRDHYADLVVSLNKAGDISAEFEESLPPFLTNYQAGAQKVFTATSVNAEGQLEMNIECRLY